MRDYIICKIAIACLSIALFFAHFRLFRISEIFVAACDKITNNQKS